MAKTRPHPVEEIAWTRVRDMGEENLPEGLSDGDLNSMFAIHEPGDERNPQLFEVSYEPDGSVDIHSHDEDEIIYILEGEMHFGNKVLRPGSSVFIAGGSYYGFKAGPEGLRFINFRARADYSFHRKGT